MAFTKIKTKDLAPSASLQKSRRRRIVFLSSTSKPRSFDKKNRPPSNKNKHPLSAMAEPKTEPKTAYISSAQESQPKSKPRSPKPLKKTRPEINLINKEQEASSETSESSSSSTKPPYIFDHDEVNGKSSPVDTPPTSPASETAPDSEKQKKPKNQEKHAPTKQTLSKQESKTSIPDATPKKRPVEQAKPDQPHESSKSDSAKPQASPSRKDSGKFTKAAAKSRHEKMTDVANTQFQRQEFLEGLDRRWPNPAVAGNGLLNPGVFCYRRSTLQCLLNIPIFVNWLGAHQGGVQTHCPGQIQEFRQGKPFQEKAKGCLACALLGLAKAYWQPQNEAKLRDATKYFDSTMRKIAFSTSAFPVDVSNFNEQQDAMEFCLWMLNTLHSHGQMDNNELQSIFGLEMRKDRRCPKCGHVGRTRDADLHISVTIPEDRTSRLEPCLEEELLRERVEGVYCENKQCTYYEGHKNKPQNGLTTIRRTFFTRLPEILIIRMKRFGSRIELKGKKKKPTFSTYKIDRPVEFPPVLDLSRYLAEGSENERTRYSLSGVVWQGGNLRSGHYWAKTVTPKGVRSISDLNVSRSKLDDLLKPYKKDGLYGPESPYVLFYTRLNDEESPLSPSDKPNPPSANKNASSKNSKTTSSQKSGTTSSKAKPNSVHRSDYTQKKRKFSDAKPESGFKKHKKNNHHAGKF